MELFVPNLYQHAPCSLISEKAYVGMQYSLTNEQFVITFILKSMVFPAIWLVKNSAINTQIASFWVRLQINRTLS